MGQKVLLVEGQADKQFFQALLEKVNVHVDDIKIGTPSDHGAPNDGKTAAFRLLSTLMNQLADGSITHLAVVLDADYAHTGGLGCAGTIRKITQEIQPFGYGNANTSLPGLTFPHNDGLNPVGLWVMPDNQSDGMLEDWVKKTVATEASSLMQHAVTTVASLPQQKFKSIHTSKADVATWMAWQTMPGGGLDTAIEGMLMDVESGAFKTLLPESAHYTPLPDKLMFQTMAG